MNRKQLDLFDAQTVEKSVEMEMILHLEEQQDNLRKGIFRRYHEHHSRIKTLETMILELAQLIKFYEDRQAS